MSVDSWLRCTVAVRRQACFDDASVAVQLPRKPSGVALGGDVYQQDHPAKPAWILGGQPCEQSVPPKHDAAPYDQTGDDRPGEDRRHAAR